MFKEMHDSDVDMLDLPMTDKLEFFNSNLTQRANTTHTDLMDESDQYEDHR
jgi:hypothetical protein